jgi:hypothetical protein
MQEVLMELKDYFENNKGFGVLSTSDDKGNVNSAVYARPHVMEDDLLAFVMRDRQSYKNIRSNPHATYLFREDGPGYKGVRLYLTKAREDKDPDLISSLSRRKYPSDQDVIESSVLVYFKREKTRPLIGG